ncbi:hypothetical protein DFP72DRAFT_843261 [Ephemerocybe angulata]|uniref:Uncharacterized protein n=1 Tax=Ephemerocybe angulata TaxID=980116 RepID=A0A8H6M9M0_9AGAR|nr:hypothetical protein DFP72DRAFT_843261 [Tulosesus angulatus]
MFQNNVSHSPDLHLQNAPAPRRSNKYLALNSRLGTQAAPLLRAPPLWCLGDQIVTCMPSDTRKVNTDMFDDRARRRPSPMPLFGIQDEETVINDHRKFGGANNKRSTTYRSGHDAKLKGRALTW